MKKSVVVCPMTVRVEPNTENNAVRGFLSNENKNERLSDAKRQALQSCRDGLKQCNSLPKHPRISTQWEYERESMSQNGKRDIVAVIPSRYASSRFEGKPLAEISGKPMIQRVYEQAKKNRTLREVVVATDDPRIAGAVNAFGGRVVMTSPTHRSGTDRTAEAAEILGLCGEDIVVNIQGDQPLIHPESLSEVAAPLLEDPELSMATLAFAIVDPRERTDPKDVKVVFDARGFALYFSRSLIPFPRDAGAEFPAFKHLGIYAYTSNFLKIFLNLPGGNLEQIEKLEQLRALEHGYRIKVIVTRHDSPEVDLPDDIPRIEGMIRKSEKPD